MDAPFKIFIGWDSRFPEPADVLAWTIEKLSSVRVDIRFLKYTELADTYGFARAYDPLATTEFTYSRFLVPYLCDFQGTALFLDNDMVCLADIAEVLRLPMSSLALRVIKHEHDPKNTSKFGNSGATQTSYPRKNWSSMMLMNCNKLMCWTKDVVETASGARLHRFQDVPDEQVGELPRGWNDLTHMTGRTRLLHYTEGGPWYAGCENCPNASVWLAAREGWLASIGKPIDTPLIPVKLGA